MAGAGSVASKRPILYLFIGLAIGLAVAAVMAGLYAKTAINYQDLLSSYNSLNQQYNSLKDMYNSLSNQYNSLQLQYESLQSQYNSLNNQYNLIQSQYEYLQSQYNSLQSEYNQLLSSLDEADSYDATGFYLAPDGFLVFPIIVPNGTATTHISALAYTNSGWSNIYIAVYRVVGGNDLNCIPNHSCTPIPIAQSQCSPSLSMDVTLGGPGQYAVVVLPCNQWAWVNVQITTSIST